MNAPRPVSWHQLNRELMQGDEAYALQLLQWELQGKHRTAFLLRIYARISKLRRQRERKELV